MLCLPSTEKKFKTRADFTSDWNYGRYVGNTVTEGMTVRMRYDEGGLRTGEMKTGEMGVVVEKWLSGGGYDHVLRLQRNNSDVKCDVWSHNVDIIG